jgi:ATP-dependent helicase YprA (DUF1998 family)
MLSVTPRSSINQGLFSISEKFVTVKEGCPSGIYSPKCGNENEPLDKKAARIILKHLTTISN